MIAARQLIGILDVVQEHRQLSQAELQLRRDLKLRFLGMSALEKLRAKQQSRLSSIRAAEANTKLFYIQVNGRRRKNFIRQLHTSDGIMHTHEEKANHILQHFSSRLGIQESREVTLDWEQIQLARHNLQHLEAEFTEAELLSTVQDIASDKAPGPDGFIGSLGFFTKQAGIQSNLIYLQLPTFSLIAMISISTYSTMLTLFYCQRRRMPRQLGILDR